MLSALASRGFVIGTTWPSTRISPESGAYALDGVDAAERDADIAHLDERGDGLHGWRVGPGDLFGTHRALAHRALRPRTYVSKAIAETSTTPTTMSWIGESTLSSSIPDRSDCITTAPRT